MSSRGCRYTPGCEQYAVGLSLLAHGCCALSMRAGSRSECRARRILCLCSRCYASACFPPARNAGPGFSHMCWPWPSYVSLRMHSVVRSHGQKNTNAWVRGTNGLRSAVDILVSSMQHDARYRICPRFRPARYSYHFTMGAPPIAYRTQKSKLALFPYFCNVHTLPTPLVQARYAQTHRLPSKHTSARVHASHKLCARRSSHHLLRTNQHIARMSTQPPISAIQCEHQTIAGSY